MITAAVGVVSTPCVYAFSRDDAQRMTRNNVDWGYHHVRLARLLFDGAPVVRNGTIAPDMSRPGLGLEFKTSDAERFAA